MWNLKCLNETQTSEFETLPWPQHSSGNEHFGLPIFAHCHKQGGRKKEHFQHEPQFSNTLVVRDHKFETCWPQKTFFVSVVTTQKLPDHKKLFFVPRGYKPEQSLATKRPAEHKTVCSASSMKSETCESLTTKRPVFVPNTKRFVAPFLWVCGQK